MAANIERRGHTWFATLHVPKDVQPTIGKSKFFETLKTTDKRIAETRAAPLVAQWKARIAAARGQSDPFIDSALQWRKDHDTNPSPDVVRSLIEDEARKLAQTKGDEAGAQFYAIATGTQTPMSPLYTDWAAQLTLAPKTIDQMKKDVKAMVDHFGTIEKVTSASVREWIKGLMQDTPSKKGYGPSSIKRIVGFCRNFWGYLQEHEKASQDSQPFMVPAAAKKAAAKTSGAKGWIPFLPAEVVKLWREAITRDDHELADLIHLGMYTGARIEELCSLKVEHCDDTALHIMDAKTHAGIRTVPIHPAITAKVKALKEASKDGYLISGLTFNKYDDRSNAVGKRFGRLKQALGFPAGKVFHSIRKTVVTQLENAGVSENLAADIVGHEKPRITYGLYSGGHDLTPMREALEKLNYPT